MSLALVFKITFGSRLLIILSMSALGYAFLISSSEACQYASSGSAMLDFCNRKKNSCWSCAQWILKYNSHAYQTQYIFAQQKRYALYMKNHCDRFFILRIQFLKDIFTTPNPKQPTAPTPSLHMHIRTNATDVPAPKLPGSMIITLTPNCFISRLSPSEKASKPNLEMVYGETFLLAISPLTLDTLITRPVEIVIVNISLQQIWIIFN